MATVQINEVVGTAWLVNADGSRTQIQPGMRVADNAKIITENGAQVVLSTDEGLPLTLAEGRELALSPEVFDMDVDAWGSVINDESDTATAVSSLDTEAARVIAALAEGVDPFEELDATAATLDGGGVGEDGSSFTRLVSIIETTTPLALAYPRTGVEFEPQILGGTTPVGEPVVEETEPLAPQPAARILIPGVITLEAPATMIEGEPYEIIARVDSPVTGTDLIIELSNGATITIPVGETEGSVIVDSPRIDDAYIQGSIPETVTITGTEGGEYSELDTTDSATTVIKDDEDLTVVTLLGPDRVVEGQPYEVIARVDNPVTGEDLIITLDNGQTIIIPVGSSSGRATIDVRADDNLVQGSEQQSVSISSVTGGNYERLEFDSTPVTTTVMDNDMPKITVSDVIFSEGTAGTFNVDFGKPVDNATKVTFHFEHKTTDDLDFKDGGAPVVMIDGNAVTVTDNGNGTYSFTLPAGKYKDVTITSPNTFNDEVFEGPEHFDLVVTQTGSTKNGTLNINVKGSGVGTIVDDGSPVDPESPDGDKFDDDRLTLEMIAPTVTEGDVGDEAVYAEFIIKTTDGRTSKHDITLKLDLGKDEDSAKKGSDYEGFEYFDGEKWVDVPTTGLVNIPAGSPSVQVRTKVVNDNIQENIEESFTLTAEVVGGNEAISPDSPTILTGTGIIEDNDILNLTVSDAGEVSEDTDAKFTVKLTNAVDADTKMYLTVLHGDTDAEDFDFSSSVVWLPEDAEGNKAQATVHKDDEGYYIVVKAGVSGEFEVILPTQHDDIYEGPENFQLKAELKGTTDGGEALRGSLTDTGDGVIVDDGRDLPDGPADDDRPELVVTGGGIVIEGSEVVFDVELTRETKHPVTLEFDFQSKDSGKGASLEDLVDKEFTVSYEDANGNTITTTITGGKGEVEIPGGVTNIKVTMPTVADGVFEGAEGFDLVVTDKSGVTKNGSDSADAAIVDSTSATVEEEGVKEQNGDANAAYEGSAKDSGNLLNSGGTTAIAITGVESAGATTTTNSDGSWSIETTYGKITVSADGEYTYELDNDAANHLSQGETHDETFTYTVQHVGKDGVTTSVTQDLVVTITGTNDRPEIDSAVTTGEITEQGADNPDAEIQVSGELQASDADQGAQLHWSFDSDKKVIAEGDLVGYEETKEGEYGQLKLVTDAEGKAEWVYTLDNDNPKTNALAEGDQETETFKVYVVDEHGAYREETITVTVIGTNDAPRIDQDLTNRGTEEETISGNVLTEGNATDPDDELEVSVFTINGVEYEAGKTAELEVGSFTLNKDGTYEFTPKENNFSGEVPTVHFTVQEMGQNGTGKANPLTVNSTLNITVDPVSDEPTVKIENVKTVEDDPVSLGLSVPVITDSIDYAPDQSYDFSERLGSIELVLGKGFDPEDVLLIDGGATIRYENGKFVYKDANGVDSEFSELKFGISDIDNFHISGMGSVILLTKDEFESIQLQAKAHDGGNRSFDIKVTSYEVDENGTPLVGVPGAETHIKDVVVDILAETDPVALTFKENQTGEIDIVVKPESGKNIRVKGQATITDNDNKHMELSVTTEEDSRINLKSLLEAAFEDLDGSEDRWVTIKNNSSESIWVNGIEVKAGKTSGKIAKGTLSEDTEGFGNIWIGGGQDFSGVFAGQLEINLHAQDRDYDSGTGTASKPQKMDIVTDTVKLDLNLTVTPVVDGLEETSVTTAEDTAVAFLGNLFLKADGTPKDSIFKDTDGSEKLQSFKLKLESLPNESKILDANGDVVIWVDADGKWFDSDDHEITSLEFDLLSGLGVGGLNTEEARDALAGFEVVPPAHSSTDFELEFNVTVKDDPGVTGIDSVEKSYDYKVPVIVTPVAEKVGEDSDGDGTSDLTMTDGTNYDTVLGAQDGTEDNWFALNQGDFDLKAGWSNQDADGSEHTYAILNPNDVSLAAGDTFDPKNAQFRYQDANHPDADSEGWVYVKYETITATNGSTNGFKIPADALDSVQFLAPKDVAGQFEIGVKAYTEDYGVNEGDVMNSAISGDALLEGIIIKPVADAATLATQGATGYEDKPIALDIRPSSTDKSETFNVKIGGIPEGSIIVYDGVLHEIGAEGTLTLENFDSNAKLTIQAPADSNKNFTLKVEAQSVDTWGDYSHKQEEWTKQDLHVKVKGVADEADLAVNEDPIEVDEDAGIPLSEIIATAALTDTDNSETLSLRISGLPEGFNVTGDGVKFMGGGSGVDRSWVIEVGKGEITEAELEALLENISITIPEHFSGQLDLSGIEIAAITTENDGDSIEVELDADAKAYIKDIEVKADLEGDLRGSGSFAEDTSISIDLFKALDSPDSKEEITAVYLSRTDVENLLKAGFVGKVGELPLDSIEFDANGFFAIDKETPIIIQTKDDHVAHKEGDDGSLEQLSFTFENIKYDMQQKHADGSGNHSDTVTKTDGSFTVAVNAETDNFEIKEHDYGETPQTVNAENSTAKFELGLKNDDTDGSERLTHIRLEGVPEGAILHSITVGEGLDAETYRVIMVGEGEWIVLPNQGSLAHFDSENLDISLNVKASSDMKPHEEEGGYPITVTMTSQDTGAANKVTKQTTVNMDAKWDGSGPGDEGPFEVNFELKDFIGHEDTPFALDELVETAKVPDVSEDREAPYFSVVVEFAEGNESDIELKLPENLENSGITIIEDSGRWIISGQGQDELNTALESIIITPPADWNSIRDKEEGAEENATLGMEITLHSYDKDSGRTSSSDKEAGVAEIEFTPVTDDHSVSVTVSDADEEGNRTINIDLSNQKDADLTIIDGKLYVKLNDGATGSISGATLVAEGNYEGYYEIDVDVATIEKGGSNSIELTYTPSDEEADGFKLSVDVTGQVQEDGAANSVDINGSGSEKGTSAGGGMEIPENGFYIEGIVATGPENQSKGDSASGIPLVLTNPQLIGDAEVQVAVIKGLPAGFLVFVDDKMALNAGKAGWSIPLTEEGEIPDNITVLPPQNWSGQLDAELVVISDGKGSGVQEQSFDIPLKVTPVADGVEALQVSQAIGKEGEPIALNLNLTLKDGKYVSETDATVERATVMLTGLGAHAAFYVGDLFIQGSYDELTDTYVLAGLSQAAANDLKVVQAADAIREGNVIDVKVTTQEYDREGDPVDGTISQMAKEDSFTIVIQPQEAATDEDDFLLYFGQELLDGKGGKDTVYLRPGDTLDFSDDAGKLKNIEVIDLSRDGHDNTITGLGQEALDHIYGDSEERTLTIIANDGDVIEFVKDENEVWTVVEGEENTNDKVVTYTSTKTTTTGEGDDAVTTESKYTVIVKKPEIDDDTQNPNEGDDAVVVEEDDDNYDGEPGLLPEMDEAIFGDSEPEEEEEEEVEGQEEEVDTNSSNDEGLDGILTEEDLSILDEAESAKTVKPNKDAPTVTIAVDNSSAADVFFKPSSNDDGIH